MGKEFQTFGKLTWNRTDLSPAVFMFIPEEDRSWIEQDLSDLGGVPSWLIGKRVKCYWSVCKLVLPPLSPPFFVETYSVWVEGSVALFRFFFLKKRSGMVSVSFWAWPLPHCFGHGRGRETFVLGWCLKFHNTINYAERRVFVVSISNCPAQWPSNCLLASRHFKYAPLKNWVSASSSTRTTLRLTIAMP